MVLKLIEDLNQMWVGHVEADAVFDFDSESDRTRGPQKGKLCGTLHLCNIGVAPSVRNSLPVIPEFHRLDPRLQTLAKMFMLKKKKPQVDTTKQMKAVVWDLSKIALVFVGIRAASVLLNQEN